MSTTPSGIPQMGPIPWGSHVCHLYRQETDLTDVLVPYFRAGLERNEKCLWVTADPLPAVEARAALGRAAPGRWTPGQIEVLDHRDWYDRSGSLDGDAVVAALAELEREALEEGYRGLRATGNTSGVDEEDSEEFLRYERMVDDAVRGRRIVALCSYRESDCSAGVLFEAFRSHGLALIREEGGWTVREAGSGDGRSREPGASLEAPRFRDELLTVLDHDLRDPLNAMTVASQILLGSDDRRYARIGARIRSSAARMVGLVDDLVDFVRGRRSRGIPVEPVSMDLSRTVRRVLRELERVHPGRSVEVRHRGPSRGEWDPHRMSQVFSNLLGNALEHGEDPLEMTLRREADIQVVEVRNGGTIADQDLERIFEPFRGTARGMGDGERSSSVESRRSGLGLGLYIVREIVRAHDGTVEARSSADEGTVFTVRLPRRPAKAGLEEVQVGG